MSSARIAVLWSGVVQEWRESVRSLEAWLCLILALALGVYAGWAVRDEFGVDLLPGALALGRQRIVLGGLGWTVLLISFPILGSRAANRECASGGAELCGAWPGSSGSRAFARYLAVFTICFALLLAYVLGYQLAALGRSLPVVSLRESAWVLSTIWLPGMCLLLALIFAVQQKYPSVSSGFGVVWLFVILQLGLKGQIPSGSALALGLDFWGCAQADAVGPDSTGALASVFLLSRCAWFGLGALLLIALVRYGGRGESPGRSRLSGESAPRTRWRWLASRAACGAASGLFWLKWRSLRGSRRLAWPLIVLGFWSVFAVWSSASDELPVQPDALWLIRAVEDPVRLLLKLGVVLWIADWLWCARERKEDSLADSWPLSDLSHVVGAVVGIAVAVFVVLGGMATVTVLGALLSGGEVGSVPLWGVWLCIEGARLMFFACLTLALQLAANRRALGLLYTAVLLVADWILERSTQLGADLFTLALPRLDSSIADPIANNLDSLGRALCLWAVLPFLIVCAVCLRRQALDRKFCSLRARWDRSSGAEKSALWASAIGALLVVGLFALHAHDVWLGNQAQRRWSDARLYEKKWGAWAGQASPRLTRVELTLKLSDRDVPAQLRYTIRNDSTRPIRRILLNLPPAWQWRSKLTPGDLEVDDPLTRVRIHRLAVPLQPGQQAQLNLELLRPAPGWATANRGIDPLVRLADLPRLGFQFSRLERRPSERRRLGLPALEVPRVPLREDVVRLDQAVTVIAPAAEQVFAPGKRVSVTREKDLARWHFEQNGMLQPDGLYGSGHYQVYRKSVPGTTIEVLYGSGEKEAAVRVAQVAQWMLDSATRRWGPYPRSELRLVAVPEISAAIAFDGLILLPEAEVFRAAKSRDGAWSAADRVVAHELAHQWWAARLRFRLGEEDLLITEGMAQAAVDLVLRDHGAPGDLAIFREAECKELARFERLQKNAPDSELLGLKLAYHRGQDLFRGIREAYGDTFVDESLREFLLRDPEKLKSFADLKKQIERSFEPRARHPRCASNAT